MVLSLRAFQNQSSGGASGSRGLNSGHISVDDTELSNRQTKSATPAPNGIFSIPHLGRFGGAKSNRGPNDHTQSADNALDGVVVSVDRLEKSDGTNHMNSNASGRRMNRDADLEKGPIGKTPSLYSEEDKVCMVHMLLQP